MERERIKRTKQHHIHTQEHSSHANELILHPALPRISDDYTNTPLWGPLLEERGACRVLENLTDSLPSTRRTFEEVASTDLLGYCLTLRGRIWRQYKENQGWTAQEAKRESEEYVPRRGI